MIEVNYNTDGRVLNLDRLAKTPLYVVKHKFNRDLLYFMECKRSEAKRMIEENHYSHKFLGVFGEVNIGVYKDGRLIGVASYGKPLDFKYDKGELIELNRMWLSDELGRNAESILLSVSIKMLRRLKPKLKFVQSFSDGRLGCGIVYQSANFKYFGYHESVFLITSGGMQEHKLSLTNESDIDTLINKINNVVSGKYDLIKVKTYRYIFELDKNIPYYGEECIYPKEAGGYEKIEYHPRLKGVYMRTYLFNEILGMNNKKLENILSENVPDYKLNLGKYVKPVLEGIKNQKPNKYNEAVKITSKYVNKKICSNVDFSIENLFD